MLELRGDRDKVLEDIHNCCFICSIERDRFQLLGTCKSLVTIETLMK